MMNIYREMNLRLCCAVFFCVVPFAISSVLAQGDAPAASKPVAPTVSAVEAKHAEELFEDGRKLFFQGKYADASKKLAQAVEANPSKSSYRLLLAKAYRFAAQTSPAVAALEELLKANPKHVEAGVELAELLDPRKEPDRVIGVLAPLLKYKHDYPLYHLLAEAYYQKEEFDKARDHYAEAVKLNSQSAEDHYQLGNIHLAQKRFAKAARSYEQAGALGLSTGVYHFKLASVYSNLHNYLGRLSAVQVIGGEPGQIKQRMYLIDAVPGRKDHFHAAGPRSAIYQVAQAQQMGIDIFDVHFLEANIWLRARRFAKADAIYRQLEEKVRKEDAGLYWFYRAQTALGLGRFDDYLARLNNAIEAEPEVYQSTLADAYVAVADRHHQQGDAEKYIEFLAKAVDVNPLSARLHLTLGDAHWLASAQNKAIEQYRLVLELEPDHRQRVRLLNRIRGLEASRPGAVVR